MSPDSATVDFTKIWFMLIRMNAWSAVSIAIEQLEVRKPIEVSRIEIIS